MKFFTNKIAKDTIILTIVSFILQGLGIFLNALITAKLGTVSVGVMTLIFTLFGFIMVLANGNIFISTSRLVSEEIGAGCKNLRRIMRYSLSFSAALSLTFSAVSMALAGVISDKLSAAADISATLRIIALSLPLASAGSCIKGYFHAHRQISVPCCGDCIEFTAKWIFLMASVLFLMDAGFGIYFLIAVSILIGEAASFVYYIIMYAAEYRRFSALPCGTPNVRTFPRYLRLSLPILVSGYVQNFLSAANDVLVPAALLKYNASAERALSEYGMFEAMIIPTVFYPAVLLGSLSNVLMPEIARANAAENSNRVKYLVHNVLCKSLAYAFFASAIFLTQGRNIGAVLCPSDSLVGETLVKMFPVIPFIYLEIILESIIKGLGRQNFSTVNSLCEYAVRILCVIVFVHFYGFTGVLISYYASNILSNIVRIIAVCRWSGVRFSICDYLMKPFIFSASGCLTADVLCRLVHPLTPFISAVIFISCAGIVALLTYETDKRISTHKCIKFTQNTDMCN